MSKRTSENEQDVALWRRFAAAVGQQQPAYEPDLNLFAAYLNGTASPAERDAIEDAMVSNATLVELLSEAREMGCVGPVDVPENVVARIKLALYATQKSGDAAACGRARAGRLAWWQHVAAAAALLMLSLVAYQLGAGTSAARRRTEADLASAVAVEFRQEQIEHDLLATFGTNHCHGENNE